jgi:hypothetical protein
MASSKGSELMTEISTIDDESRRIGTRCLLVMYTQVVD